MKQSCTGPWVIGANYFIRTVTHHYTGRLEAVYQKELVLSEVAWIADDGRFHNALATGQFNEIEPMIGNVIIGRGSIVDASIWGHELPRQVK